MTGREKVSAALSRDGSSETPVVVPYEGIFLRDHWSDVTDQPWWLGYLEDIDVMMRIARDYMRKVDPDWHYGGAAFPRQAREYLRIEKRSKGVFLVNLASGEETELTVPTVGGWSPDGMCASHRPTEPPTSPDEIDEGIPEPEPLDADELRADGSADCVEAFRREFDAFQYASVSSPLWQCYQLWGFEGLMTTVAERPGLVRHACERYLALAMRRVRAAAAVGTDGIFIEECMTDMVSPDAFAELCLPGVRALTEEVRDAGLLSIYYFCGNPAGKWECLLASGADALSLEESKKGFTIDIDDVVDRVGGRMSVLGNLSAIGVMATGTEEELRTEIARQLAAGRRNGNRFIMSLGSPVTPGTSVERVRLYCELTRELGAR